MYKLDGFTWERSIIVLAIHKLDFWMKISHKHYKCRVTFLIDETLQMFQLFFQWTSAWTDGPSAWRCATPPARTRSTRFGSCATPTRTCSCCASPSSGRSRSGRWRPSGSRKSLNCAAPPCCWWGPSPTCGPTGPPCWSCRWGLRVRRCFEGRTVVTLTFVCFVFRMKVRSQFRCRRRGILRAKLEPNTSRRPRTRRWVF